MGSREPLGEPRPGASAGLITGAIVGDALLLVADTQLRKLGPDGKPSAPLDPFVVLRVPLTATP